jgi:hypothetical protein
MIAILANLIKISLILLPLEVVGVLPSGSYSKYTACFSSIVDHFAPYSEFSLTISYWSYSHFITMHEYGIILIAMLVCIGQIRLIYKIRGYWAAGFLTMFLLILPQYWNMVFYHFLCKILSKNLNVFHLILCVSGLVYLNKDSLLVAALIINILKTQIRVGAFEIKTIGSVILSQL